MPVDPRTEHELHKIAKSVYKDPMKFVKDEFHENQIQQAHDILAKTQTSNKNEWSLEENRQAERAANMVLKRLDGSHHEVDAKKAQELDRQLGAKIEQAIRSGRIKPASRNEYHAYVDSIKRKK